MQTYASLEEICKGENMLKICINLKFTKNMHILEICRYVDFQYVKYAENMQKQMHEYAKKNCSKCAENMQNMHESTHATELSVSRPGFLAK